MKKLALISFFLVFFGCGNPASKVKAADATPDKPAKPRISDFKRQTLLEIIRATEGPIRADLEERLKFWQEKKTPPDKVTFQQFYEMYGQEAIDLYWIWDKQSGNVEMRTSRYESDQQMAVESAVEFYGTTLTGLIAYAKEKKSVPSKVAKEFFTERLKAAKADAKAPEKP